MLPLTTAQRIRRKLEAEGVPGTEITLSHVESVYGALRPLTSKPDFARAEDLLAPLDAIEPTDSGVTAVMIETRAHPNAGPVLDSVFRNVDCPIQIFHGRENGSYLRQAIRHDMEDRVTFVELATDALSASVYNALLLSERFWRRLNGRRKILVFQTDSMLCQGSSYGIEDFLGFDYIGPAWTRSRPVGIVADGGFGGLSLRDWPASVDCLRRFPPRYWNGGEDGYFCFHLDLIGAKVGDPDACARFATQEFFVTKSFGVHQPTWLSKADQHRFMAYCPESSVLFE